ncbi:MAG: rRNA pseudouridine synthase [Pirellulales bacterium]|nr:rRNA pseudouridine synthase [Pirellulales bacterium]
MPKTKQRRRGPRPGKSQDRQRAVRSKQRRAGGHATGAAPPPTARPSAKKPKRPRRQFGQPSELARTSVERAPIAAPSGPQRLQKVLAAAGVGSRRRCEELIVDGRVEIDRQVVTQLGTRVDPGVQEIRVDGAVLPRARRVYYVVNKPVGVISTNYDPAGRTRVIDLVHAGGQRVYTVGRLDRNSEGLILVTNDGELANRLMHPRYGVEKTYLVRVAGAPSDEVLEQLTSGVRLAEGNARAERVTLRSARRQSTQLEIVLREGRNREVRRILARVGHKVLELKRIALGPLRLKDLEPGEVRQLTTAELRDLRRAARLVGKES